MADGQEPPRRFRGLLRVLSIPAPASFKSWWEFIAIVISLFALWVSWYKDVRVAEEASVAVARAAISLDPNDLVEITAWISISNRGTRNLVVVQSPLYVLAPDKNLVLIDETPLQEQPAPTQVEAGKLGVVVVHGKLSQQALRSLLINAKDDVILFGDGRTHVLRLLADIVVLYPSGNYAGAATGCIRLPFKGERVLERTFDAKSIEVTRRESDAPKRYGTSPCHTN